MTNITAISGRSSHDVVSMTWEDIIESKNPLIIISQITSYQEGVHTRIRYSPIDISITRDDIKIRIRRLLAFIFRREADEEEMGIGQKYQTRWVYNPEYGGSIRIYYDNDRYLLFILDGQQVLVDYMEHFLPYIGLKPSPYRPFD